MENDDWILALDQELEKKRDEILKDVNEQNTRKANINRTLIKDFWNIWLRFNKINIHMTMEPSHTAFAQFEEFPERWRFKPNFDFSAVNTIQLVDKTLDQGRVGDSIKVRHYYVDKVPHLRMVFEFCEGEHYYKYSGWKRIFVQYILYDSPLNKVSVKRIHEILADIIKVWYESHLRRNRDMLLKYIKDNFEKGETFTQ
ncbi:MAG: hypothetical protein DRN20_03065 [Thermoplasmata archaeon]|nr:MAG: hypothetical protein DRN20_03065 [Thermoplasmata archaeon]